ncbi:glycosyltransferase 87 family protein [Pedococcus sp. 2YAF34]|uniref:glycosyltransferase 87 family protein n=1 Tax=Pedococcus sp. 2YAF34 TaxID=3233032 RepID=UPI003F9C5824
MTTTTPATAPPGRPPRRVGAATSRISAAVARATRWTAAQVSGWSSRSRWALAVFIVLAGASIPVLRYLVFWPLDQWQVDVEVYREAGVSILTGRPIYSAMTEAPQLLPFTYPPFAAVIAVPLALLPFGAVGWLWTAAQVAATTAIVWYAGWRLIHRTGPLAPVTLALLTVPMLWLHPVSDGLRFGQVNAFMVLACLMDLRRPRPGVLRRIPPGVLVGLAMSIKLTPGVFVVHYLLNKRWKEAATAVGTAVAVTVGAWLLLPEASFAFWGGALQDPTRLGPNAGTSNQSIRGFLLRVGPDGFAGNVLWLVLVAVVGVVGYALARRAHRAGDSISEVAAVGLMAVLLSPVAWIHHLHWMVVVVLAVLGADPWRDRRRLVAAAVVTGFFLCRMPWWGISWLSHPHWPQWPGRILQNADTFGSLLALGLLWWALHLPEAVRRAEAPGVEPTEVGAAER